VKAALADGDHAAASTVLLRYLNSRACTPEFLVELLTSLYNHARRIELMPYPNRDNFVMIETLGLASVATLFPEFRDAPTWQALVMERLAAALRAQVLPDGTHGELAPSYHLLITRYYLELIDLFGAEAVSPDIRSATERMAEFCLAISAPDRKTFFVGDTNARLDLRPALATATARLRCARMTRACECVTHVRCVVMTHVWVWLFRKEVA
jgi:hypothetical protein